MRTGAGLRRFTAQPDLAIPLLPRPFREQGTQVKEQQSARAWAGTCKRTTTTTIMFSLKNIFSRISRYGMVMACMDLLALCTTFLLVYLLRKCFGGNVTPGQYLPLLLLFPLALIINLLNGLYSLPRCCLHEELRDLSISTSLTYGVMLLVLFSTQSGPQFSRITLMGAWLASLASVPLARVLSHSCLASHVSWWRRPAACFFLDPEGTSYRKLLLSSLRHRGLTIQAVGKKRPAGFFYEGLICLDSAKAVQDFVQQHPDAIALVCLSSPADTAVQKELRFLMRSFRKLILLPAKLHSAELPVSLKTVSLGNDVGLCMRRNLLDPWQQFLKLLLDFTGGFLASCLLLPVMTLIALAILLETRATPFFWQERIGYGGKRFRILKFRTMVPDAEQCLQRYLAASPQLAAEWKATQKLQHDPRVTRIGKFLRSTSLDELPQLWNVLRHEMSMVGPRPIVENEIAKYGAAYEAYTQVLPGMTGLWQISGRSNTSYAQRIHLDLFYIANWSIWLDISIILRTIPALLKRDGAV